MAKLQYLNIQLDSPNGAYFSGQQIKGTLMICCPIAVQVQKIGIWMIGESRTHWINKASDVIFEAYEPYFNEFIDLTGYLSQVSDGELIPEGTHQITFSYQLPVGLPSSFENEFGFTRYRSVGKVEVITPSCFMSGCHLTEHPCEKVITVFAANSPGCFRGYDVPAVKEETTEILGCFGSKGSVNVSLAMPKTEFAMGTNITGSLTVHNQTRGVLKSIEIGLMQETHLESISRYESVQDSKDLKCLIESTSVGPVKPAKAEKFDIRMPVPQMLAPSQTGHIISIQYKLIVSSDRNNTQEISMPIVITIP